MSVSIKATFSGSAETFAAKISVDDTAMTAEMKETGGSVGNIKLQSKSASPSPEQQMVTPDAGYYGLSDVTIKPIPYYEVSNTGGGDTVYIGKELE